MNLSKRKLIKITSEPKYKKIIINKNNPEVNTEINTELINLSGCEIIEFKV